MPGSDPTFLRTTFRQIGRGLLFAAMLTGFTNVLMLIVPLFTMQVYDRVMSSRSLDTLAMLAVVAVGGLTLYAVLDYIRARVFLITGSLLSRRLNVPTLQAAILDALGGGRHNAGQAMRDLNDLRSFVTGNSIAVPMELLWTPIFLTILFLLHPVYGWLAVGAALLLLAVNALTDLLTRRPLAQANEASARAFADVAATVRHAEAIEAMGMLPALARRWRTAHAAMAEMMDRGTAMARAMASASRALRLILQIAIISAGATLVINQEVSPGSMMAASILMGRMLHPFEQLIEGWRQWVFALAALRRVRGLLRDGAARRDTMALPPTSGRLAVDRLSYIPPGHDRPILRSVSFQIEPGEVLGIIGPSGAGKSTLARLIVGIWEPAAGGVYLDGHSTFLWERESFGRGVGYVPQGVALLDGTIRDNIARMTDADPAEVVRAARLAGVHDMIGRLPFGYDTPVGDGSFVLSGGQRQRIALARALFGAPRLLVLDEPNASLDTIGEQALLHALGQAKADGVTVIMIAHRPSVVSIADKLLVLKDGAVERFGPRAEIMSTVLPGGTPKVARLVKAGDTR
ncbi:MAG TPA: type I secretion system permease/ATPase [Arenibaculum sp.]|nr:type I secretion system permease/ATPase [Arenibaculum sp.]